MFVRRVLLSLLPLVICISSLPAWAADDVVVLLDSSAAMAQGDSRGLGVRALGDFINSRGPDTRVALITFAAEPVSLLSFTTLDSAGHAQFAAALKQVQFAGPAADVSAGLERGLAQLIDHSDAQATKNIVLITHGEPSDSTASGRDEARWILRSLLPAATFNEVRVFALVRAPAAAGVLRTLAQQTGGSFTAVSTPGDLAAAFRALGPELAKPALAPLALPPPGMTAAAKFATPLTQAAQPQSMARWLWLALLIVVVAAVVAVYAVWNLRVPKAARVRAKPAEPPGSGAHAVLYDISNPNDIRRFELDERATLLGRVPGFDPEVQYILIKEKTVGRCHAVIERRGHTFWITDQGSVNGTFVNGERIGADRALKHGDVIAVHRHEFEFMIPEYFESDATVVGARESAAA